MVYTIDPLHDPRWVELVNRHPEASVFHTVGWLRALQRTYGFEPVAFTTSSPGEALRNAMVFCSVRSWLTGNRLVSLPFSDHCDPLFDSDDEWNALRLNLAQLSTRRSWRCVETRPASSTLEVDSGFRKAGTFYLHRVDLRPSLDALRGRFHKDSVQRKLRRAEREGLTYETGRSESLLNKLYSLILLTRQRHHLPPQPIRWFRHLIECVGEDACIRIASKHDQLVAGILTLRHGKKVVYKYGGSDARLHNLGGMQFLFWKAIQEAKQAGAEEFDLGRSDVDNPGLIAFKEHWAAERSTLTYWSSASEPGTLIRDGWKLRFAKQVFARLPNELVAMVGRLIYRHIG